MMKKSTQEKFENLKITDVWIFQKVFVDPKNLELSKELVQRCTGLSVDAIKEIQSRM